MVSACINHKESAPKEAIAEMALLGVTLTYEGRPPRSMNLTIVPGNEGVEPFVTFENIGGPLALYFAPHPDHDTVEYPTAPSNGWSEYPYEFTYSKLIDGEYIEIPPLDYSEDYFYVPNRYHNRIRITDQPRELIVSGNHILRTSPWEMPLNATHVELWYQENAGADRTLVRRTPMESLFAWRRYVQPLLVEQSE